MAADGVLILMAAYGLLGYLEDCKGHLLNEIVSESLFLVKVKYIIK